MPPEATEAEEKESETEETSEEETEQEEDSDKDEDSEEESSDDEDSEDADENEEDESDEELKAVFRLFKNPSTRKQALMLLAQQEGLKLASEERSEKENKGTPKTLAELLREEMGDEYDMLPASFTKALGKVFAVREQSIRAEIDADRAERTEIESNKAVTRLFKNFPDAKKLEPQILSYMKAYPPPRGQEMYDYMRSMYRLAKSDSDERSEKASRATNKVDRINKGRRESSMKTRSAGTGNLASGKEPANLKEAVMAAAKELSEKRSRR